MEQITGQKPTSLDFAPRLSTGLQRFGTKAAIVATVISIITSLTGCGGGDDEAPGTGPAVDESTYVRCDNGRTAYTIEECRTMQPLPKPVQS